MTREARASFFEYNGILQISFRKLDIYVIYIAYDGILDVIYDGKNDFWQKSTLSEKIEISGPNFENFGS